MGDGQAAQIEDSVWEDYLAACPQSLGERNHPPPTHTALKQTPVEHAGCKHIPLQHFPPAVQEAGSGSVGRLKSGSL